MIWYVLVGAKWCKQLAEQEFSLVNICGSCVGKYYETIRPAHKNSNTEYQFNKNLTSVIKIEETDLDNKLNVCVWSIGTIKMSHFIEVLEKCDTLVHILLDQIENKIGTKKILQCNGMEETTFPE